jgi:hypothetical protein
MTSETFYASLPVLDRFVDLANPQNYVKAPADWYVLITDVVASTEAIERGQYKDVNVLGASSIMAVLNALNPLEVPFIFGGDGAVLLVPPSALHQAREALLGVRAVAEAAFGLSLRVGVVPVDDIDPQRPVKVAKFRLSPSYCQASFIGGGVTQATKLIKTDPVYRLDVAGQSAAANLTGLECRWQALPSDRGHTLSLIVAARSSGSSVNDYLYQDVLGTIAAIYGDLTSYHPLSVTGLRLTLNPLRLWAEARARSHRPKPYRMLAKVYLETLLGYGLMRFGIKAGEVDWGRYKQDVWAASDYQKIDDTLRMVIAGSPAQTKQLMDYLEQRFRQGHLTYGLHISDRALMTCLIMNRRDRHFHLIDGADGGYALAAKAMKAQLHAIRTEKPGYFSEQTKHSRPISKPSSL